VTAYKLTSATLLSVEEGTPAPLVAEAIRQGGGWGGAVAGAEVIGLAAARAGLRFGPAATIGLGLVGGLIGGALGYFGSDWLADYVHEN